jgi:hypothetical protein
MSRNNDQSSPSTSAKAPPDSSLHEPLLDAMHLLEAALALPAPGREEAWRDRVAAELATFRNVLATHVASTESRKGMFVDVERIEPALHHRIERLRYEHADLLRQAESLETHLAPSVPGHPFNFHDVRQRAGWLLTALRHHQALEADLVFELYDSDVGVGD